MNCPLVVTCQSKAKLPTIGKEVDNAMDAIEKDNPSLKGCAS